MASLLKKPKKKKELVNVTEEIDDKEFEKKQTADIIDVVEVAEEVKVEVTPAVTFKKEDIVNQNQEIINKLKEKLMNGTITDGEAAEYRMLVNK